MDYATTAKTVLRCIGLANMVGSVIYGFSGLVTNWDAWGRGGGLGAAALVLLVPMLAGVLGGLAVFFLAGPLAGLAARGLE